MLNLFINLFETIWDTLFYRYPGTITPTFTDRELSEEETERIHFLAEKVRQQDEARRQGRTPDPIDPDEYEQDWQAELEYRAEQERQQAERRAAQQAAAIATLQAEQAAIKTEIPEWLVQFGREFRLTSIEDLRRLKAYVREILLYASEHCEGRLSIREMKRAGIPGSPNVRLFYEELSKVLTQNHFLMDGKTGSKGRKIVAGWMEKI
jgi:hypothetical protein